VDGKQLSQSFSVTGILITLVMLAAGPLPAARFEMGLAGKGMVHFVAVAKPGGLHIEGKTPSDQKDALEGTLTVDGLTVSGEATYKMDALDTGIGLRNRHMKEKYLQVPKFPTATFKLTKLRLPQAFVDGDFVAKDEPFTADLTLHGETKPVEGHVSLKREGENINMVFKIPVSLKSFKIEQPSYLGITVQDAVDLDVDINTKLVRTDKKGK
jgi:polyisoprenoid-binding protein YceI